MLLIGEALLRRRAPAYNLASYRRFLSLSIDPPNSMYEPDPLLGFRHVPGSQVVTSNNVSWRQTHGADSLRVLPRTETTAVDVWVFGCSYTHGWGVNDPEPYAALLQQRLRDARVTNFGTDGYGTVQALLQFREGIKRRPKPALVILGHIADHMTRDSLCPGRLKTMALLTGGSYESIPYATYAQGQLRILHRPLVYQPIFGASWSAILNVIDSVRCEQEDSKLQSRMRETTLAVIGEFNRECREIGARFVVAGVDPTAETLRASIEEAGVPFVAAWPPAGHPAFCVSPSDAHPNARGHDFIARRIVKELERRRLLETGVALAPVADSVTAAD